MAAVQRTDPGYLAIRGVVFAAGVHVRAVREQAVERRLKGSLDSHVVERVMKRRRSEVAPEHARLRAVPLHPGRCPALQGQENAT